MYSCSMNRVEEAVVSFVLIGESGGDVHKAKAQPVATLLNRGYYS